MRQLHKLILAGGLVAGCFAVGFSAIQGSMVTSVPFDQVSKRSGPVQIYGILDKASIRPLRGYNLVEFDLVEEKTGKRMAVLYENHSSGLPANFPTASHAKASGIYDPMEKHFVSDAVMTKCPSKYKEEDLDVATRNAMKKWQGDATAKTEADKVGDTRYKAEPMDEATKAALAKWRSADPNPQAPVADGKQGMLLSSPAFNAGATGK
jgi:cytochrome c-type biogenesis protein CcmE